MLVSIAECPAERRDAYRPWFEAILASPDSADALPDPGSATALVIVTEGATDPGAYERIVGRTHDSVGRVLTAIR